MHRRSLQWETLEALPMEETRQQLAKPFGVDVSAICSRLNTSQNGFTISRIFKIVTRKYWLCLFPLSKVLLKHNIAYNFSSHIYHRLTSMKY
jgi:hypothetical protein